ncbi:hypothetical protein [Legionella waltersii]|uniref:Uncharacterized protein n=1 Tax=Legionella waltersii TaxID=66969 RepID=A0A0W1A232_9GAMM|nr:hypothetical protein [Legionella waltersii]KTD75200.1 hypothetical protein Lwal_3241 [Legionella waltersii]SNV10454.1 Uncharacterised protein [Legionella waltersii]
MEEYNEQYEVKNTYPIGHYLQSCLIERLFNAFPTEIAEFQKKYSNFNAKEEIQINADHELHPLNQVRHAAQFVKSKGGELKLTLESIKALLKLESGVRAWLLQRYQLNGNQQIGGFTLPKSVFDQINKFFFKLDPTQARDVQKQVCYSLFLNTQPSLSLWKKIFPSTDNKYDRIVPLIFYKFADNVLFCWGMVGWFSRLQAAGLLAFDKSLMPED